MWRNGTPENTTRGCGCSFWRNAAKPGFPCPFSTCRSGQHLRGILSASVGLWRLQAPYTADGIKCQLKHWVSFSFASMKGNRWAGDCNCSTSSVKVVFCGRPPIMILLVNLCFGLYVRWSLVTWSLSFPNISVFHSLFITFVFFFMLKIDMLAMRRNDKPNLNGLELHTLSSQIFCA